MNEVKNKLLSASNDGNFLEVAYQLSLHHGDKRQSIGKEIASLHNEGKIDAVVEFRQFSKGMTNLDFFLVRYIFEGVLPELNAPMLSVMDCVKHLVIEAGNDMTASWIFEPFIKYCEADQNRPEEVLQIIESSDDEWLDFIPPAVIAGSNLQLSKYIATAIALTSHDNIEVRVRAVFALGKINYCNDKSLLDNVLQTLESVVQFEDDDNLLSTIIKSAFYLYTSDNNLEKRVVILIEKALTNKGDTTLCAASNLFGYETDKLPESFLDILLDALKSTKPQHKGTLDQIDYGLQHLVKNNQEEKAISFLEHILVHNDELSIKVFNHLTRDLHNNKLLLSKLVTRWFLSKEFSLCESIQDIVRIGLDDDILLLADTNQFTGKPEGSCLFAARKAVGWLFMNPVSATSFIVSLIDASGDDEAEPIIDLLFYPLLISYPGKVKEYLNNQLPNKSPKVQKALTISLAKLDIYHDGLKAAWGISELLPSQAHRETYNRMYNREFTKSYKKAEKNSIINLLCHKEILLYGRKSINYVRGSNGQINRMEIPMQSYGHSIEFPGLEYIDPHGLDYMLRVFRVEGCKE